MILYVFPPRIFIHNLLCSAVIAFLCLAASFAISADSAHGATSKPAAITAARDTAAAAVGQEEEFADPTVEELHAHGEWLVGRRVSVVGYGPGTVVSFNKTYLQGASTHDIEFDSGAAPGQEKLKVRLKLARKSNTDPEKKPWKVATPPRVRLATPVDR